MTTQEKIDEIYKAWTIKGINPRYHDSIKEKLKIEWPTLYNAIIQLIDKK